ncbi:MAG: HlyD family secretion protein [Candidatus Eisenbacteria bacterium]|nr:HlyD family secretion protein [Candidatus Eisenbacteria bacterium]
MSASVENPELSGTPAEAEAAPARRRLPVAPIVFAVVLVIGGGIGVQRWLWSRGHVETDNAQIEGSVVPAIARVGGYVTEVPVVENQRVRAGDLLVLLDDRESRTKLAQAEAELALALANAGERGRVGMAQAQLEAARAQVVQAQANAGKTAEDARRYTGLAGRGIVSPQQLDAAKAAAEAAGATLTAARKQVLAAEAALAGSDARLRAARAARDQAALQLSYTRVTAPVSGVVSRKNVDPGQYLQAGQSTMAVVELDSIYVVANLKETSIANVRVGDDVRVDVDAYPGHPFKGHVESLSPATGATFSLLPPDNATGNFTKVVQHVPARIRVDGPADPQRPLRPGMSVNVTITTRAR